MAFALLCLAAFVGLASGAIMWESLTYFDILGRGEQIRLWFADKEVKYKDIRVTGDEWPAIKKTFPWGKIPVLNDTMGHIYADSEGIAVVLTTDAGVWPSDQYVAGELMSYAGASEDLRISMNDNFPDNSTDNQRKFLPIFQDWLGYFEKNLDHNGLMPYLSGASFTAIDTRVWDILNQITMQLTLYPDVLKPYAKANAFYTAVETRPNIAAYLRTRKV